MQGKCQPEIKTALGAKYATPTVSAKSTTQSQTKQNTYRKIFVVYGHDETAKNHLEAMLRRWGLEPLILDQLPSEGQTIIEKLEKYTADVHFAVVLATRMTKAIEQVETMKKHIVPAKMLFLSSACCFHGWEGIELQSFSNNKRIWTGRQIFKG